MINKILNWLKNEDGAETLEYIIIAGLIVVAGFSVYNTSIGSVIQHGMEVINSVVNTTG